MSWFKVHSGKVKTHQKFRALDNAALGAWMRIRAEVDILDGEPLPDRDYADAVAQGDHGSVERLIDVGLLDLCDDGAVAIHDLDDWGRVGHVKPSDSPERVTERVRRHRERQRQNAETPDETPETPETTEERRVEEKRVEESKTRARARTSSPSLNDELTHFNFEDPVDVWEYLFGRRPTQRMRDTYLADWLNTERPAGVIALLRACHAARAAGDREALDEVKWITARIATLREQRMDAAAERAAAEEVQRRERIAAARDAQAAALAAANPMSDEEAERRRAMVRGFDVQH